MTRILTLLLITQVTAEWVEISQQHYRKPIRAHSPFTTSDRVTDIEDTTKHWSFNNRSVPEYSWNKNPARPPNNPYVKRVQHIGSPVKTTERPEDDDDLDLHVNFKDYELKPNYGPTKPITILEHDKQTGTIERVPNVGNIKRVQLNNSPVKSPTLSYKGDREKYSNKRYDSSQQDSHEANEFEHKNTESFNRRIYINRVNNPHNTERPVTFPPDDDDNEEQVTSYITEKSNQDLRHFYSTRPSFVSETEGSTYYDTQQNRFYKITNSKSSEVTEKINVYTTEIIDTEESTKSNAKPTTTKANKNNFHKTNDLKAQSNENIVNNNNSNKGKHSHSDHHQTETKSHYASSLPDHQNESKKYNESKDKNDEALPSNKTKKNKINTMENLIKFMRVVADTISKNSRRSFGGKMEYLRELKETILANIEERIDATWPDDESAGARRHSRSAHASPRGHVQFPSSESSLMTISFLTFAVFLIKLVLQVIQTYKQKAMMVAPLMVASAGRKVFAHRGHH